MKTKSKKIPQYWLKDSVWVGKTIIFRLRILLVVVLLGLFLPWRQNIQATGKVITLLPDQRPQEVQTNIAGRVSVWRIKEGDFIKKGDTVVVLSVIDNLVKGLGRKVKLVLCDAISAQALADGMVPLPHHALVLARQGLIPLHEAYRMRAD